MSEGNTVIYDYNPVIISFILYIIAVLAREVVNI